MKIADTTVVHNLGLEACGGGANMVAADVKDGKLVRIRPVHYDEHYTKEELNYWTLTGRNGTTFEPGMKSCTPSFPLVYKRRTYSKNRITHPMKRVDWDPQGERHPETRGTSKYVRISWDEATELIAAEIKRIHDEYGPYSILCQADGHGESKAVHAPHGCMTRLLELCGGYTVQARNPDSWEGWYWGAKHAWGMDPVGQNTHSTNTAQDIAQNCDAMLYWGCDLETTTSAWGGQLASKLAYWFDDCGIKHIAIAPDCNYTAAVHADKWFPVLPNTDAALQLAIAYVWMVEGTYEKEYVETHAIGYDWLEYYVLGQEDGVPKTPEWAEPICGIPAYRIKALARYWARHNVSIAHCNGGSFIRAAFAHEPARLEVYLLGMQGVGMPGRIAIKFIEWTLFGMTSCSPIPPSKLAPSTAAAYNGWIIGSNADHMIAKCHVHKALRGESFSWYGHGTAANDRPDQFVKLEFPTDGNAGIKMLWSDNPAFSTSLNGGYEYQDALKSDNLEFYLVQAPWFEDDARFADIVLPICTKFETSDFGTDCDSGQWNAVIYEQAAIEPVGEARSDWEAVQAVAEKLERYGGAYKDVKHRMTGGKTVEQQIREGYEACGIPAEEQDFEAFKRNRYQLIPTVEGWEDQMVGLSGFAENPALFPLETPSGKIEYYSPTLAENFPDDHIRGPVAHWIESGDGHDDRRTSGRAQKYPFLVESNHPRWRVHAEFDDVEWFREIETCKVIGPDGYAYEPVWLNPSDAAKLGIRSGDVVSVFNERGAVLGGARVTERVRDGVVYMDHGANSDVIVSGIGGLDRGGDINLICPTHTSSKNASGEVTSGYLAGVEKADVFALAEKYPEEFGRAHYTPEYGADVRDYLIGEE
ncbi:molybdopterin-dependent oxidoreductase [Gordonibacter sp. RACS_AR49]|uniref:molybdopterin-dependent oxidoreductase n=1 Tax=Gordonibacter sp. RACS_AR49 TaxID=2871986 RepID=UPI00261CAAF4|nr:molybdopterin-dependent oxidoreductase [Gordonibacter sp. RACS_AR49]MDN4508467.1 molybdopterin-dependent oxidoreductase [Gordonibacter sp. RACS_AR49]